MTRGPIPKKAIDAALVVARTRGIVSLCQRGKESVCDIVIHATGRTIDAAIRRCRRLHCSLTDMEWLFADSVARLRLLPDNPCRSRELWACSPYGVLRFFRVLKAGLVELGTDGEPVSAGA
jgi:hypothetical protein